MALYLGKNKVTINLNNIQYLLNLFSEMPIANGVRLLSFDNYILKDANGLFIMAKESE